MDIIITTEALARACKTLANADYVAIDTEFLREKTFWSKLCLVQMAGPDIAVIVDVLADGLDLAPLLALMQDEAVIKVFHAGRQDIEIIYHLGGFIPHPVFDTQIAAMVCGFGDSISYDQLVNRVTKENIDKSSRFTDWSRRPLTEKQLQYALADVTHLRDIYHVLRTKLEQQNRQDWVFEEMDILTSSKTYRSHPEDAWRRLKIRAKKPIELAVTKALATWREEQAQERDVPRNRVLKDDAIYEIATQRPTTAQALSSLRTIPQGFERSQSGGQILNVVKTACTISKEDLPSIPVKRQQNEGLQAVIDLFKVLLKSVADDQGVAAKVIATVDDLEKMAIDDHAEVNALKGWRRTLFGEQALKLKRGEICLVIRKGKVAILPL